MKWARRLIVTVGIGYVGLCLALYCYQEKLLFHPHMLASDYTFKLEGKYQEFNLPIENGCVINGLHFFADSPAIGCIVYFHGNSNSIEVSGKVAKTFTSRGYDIVMVDYPGYGKSSGAITEENLFNTGKATLNYAKARYSSDDIIIYGKSLGTGVAAHTAREGEWFKALILETPYYSIVDIAQRQYPYLPISWLCKYPLSTYLYLEGLHHPIYAIHGTADKTIPIASPRRFLKLGLRDFHLIEVAGGEHGNIPSYEAYSRLLDAAMK